MEEGIHVLVAIKEQLDVYLCICVLLFCTVDAAPCKT